VLTILGGIASALYNDLDSTDEAGGALVIIFIAALFWWFLIPFLIVIVVLPWLLFKASKLLHPPHD
jgi:fatty acid desaturase